METLQYFDDLRHEVGAAADDAPPIKALSATFRYREPNCLKRRQIAEQLIDLERRT
jgi:hypothetical protein